LETAPSAAVVAAVLAFGDVREPCEDGTTMIRLSPARLASDDIQMLLRRDSARALDVRIIWSETDLELVRIIDIGCFRKAQAPAPAQIAQIAQIPQINSINQINQIPQRGAGRPDVWPRRAAAS
jgi:hypothetical protein